MRRTIRAFHDPNFHIQKPDAGWSRFRFFYPLTITAQRIGRLIYKYAVKRMIQ